MCQSMVNIQSPTAEIRRGKKRRKKKEERTNHSMKIYMVSLFHRATINQPSLYNRYSCVCVCVCTSMVVAYRTGLIIFPQTIVIALTDVIYRRKTSTVRSSRDVHTQCGAESCRRADLRVRSITMTRAYRRVV